MAHVTKKYLLVRKALGRSTALRTIALASTGLAAVGLSAPATAQNFTTGALVGSVSTPDGARVSEGTVTIRSTAQGFSRTATLNGDGSFRIQALPPGAYVVTVEAAGQPAVTDTVLVNPGSSNTYNFTVGGAPAAGAPTDAGSGEDIVVTGAAQRGNDFDSNTGGLQIGDVTQLLNTTPIARNQTALILLSPGATAGDSTFGNLASLSGATVAENAYYVNGLNVTNFRNFVGSNNPPIEFYKSFETKTFGLAAEFGRVLGGFTTAVTKSGSNNFEAGALVAYSPNSLRNDSPNTYAAFNQADFNENIESNFYLSGPIIKDRVFFYGLYNPNYSKIADSSITGGQRLTQTTNSPFFGGKVDVIIADGHRLEGTYFRNARTFRTRYDAFSVASGVGGYVGSTVEKSGGDNFVGTYTGQFTPWLTLSGSYGENHDDQSFAPAPNQSLVQSTLTGTTTTAAGFNSGLSTDEDTRKFYRADADVYVNLLGSHHFRGGWERENLTSTTDTQYSGQYRYQISPTFIRRFFYLNQGTFKSKNDSYYIQDNWSLANDRLNLQLGLRNDRFSNDALNGETYFKSGNQWGPRLGAAFDVFGDKRTAIRGSWSRYFLPVATNTNIRLGGAELYYRQQFAIPAGVNTAVFDRNGLPTGLNFDSAGNILGLNTFSGGTTGPCPGGPVAGQRCNSITSDGVQGPTDTLVSSTLQSSYTDEWTLGVQQRLGDWDFSLTYINRRLGRTLDDVAVDAAVLAYCDANNISGCDSVWTGFHQYVLSNPGQDITVRLDGDCDANAAQCQVATLKAADLGYPKPVRKFDSVQFTFNKAYRDGWGIGGSYVYTKLRGNYEGAVKSDNGQDDAGLTQDFDQPGLLEGAYGTLANGRAHAFKLFGTAEVTNGVRFGANMLFESPRKFSCIGVYPDADNFAYQYQNASFFCRQPEFSGRPSQPNTATGGNSYLVDRSTAFKSQWRKQIDVNAQVDIAQFPGSFISVDVFNVFNFKSKVDYNEFGDNPDGTINAQYRQPIGYQAPRSVRFTFGLRFGGNTSSQGGTSNSSN
jgi:hypothetical protein